VQSCQLSGHLRAASVLVSFAARGENDVKTTKAKPKKILSKKANSASAAEGPRIGARLKHARLAHHMRLKDVADGAGCSESMLSKIENERAIPSLTTLHRLCKALSLSVSTLLSSDSAEPWTIMRPAQRRMIGHSKAAGSEGVLAEILVPSANGRLLEGFLVIIEPGGHTNGTLQHKGEEVGFVIEGELELTINNEKHLLRSGDSFYFPSELPHAYRNPGKTRMRAIWINTPPTF
jgi:quercetin dioxygenase-like cupin family protein/DNA-binding XRE family transcriptional regulator